MIRATTPTHTFVLKEFTVAQIKDLRIIYSQLGEVVCEKGKSDCSLNGNKISVTLTQEETKRFREGRVELQLRVLTDANMALATKVIDLDVTKVLDDEVMR